MSIVVSIGDEMFDYRAVGPDGTHADCTSERFSPVALALWANQIMSDCLAECGGDVNAAIAAADMILQTQPIPDGILKRPIDVSLANTQPVYEHRADPVNLLHIDDYPRDKSKRFMSKHILAAAAKDNSFADTLRGSLSDEETTKFNKCMSHLTSGGAIHHPKEPSGLAINIDGTVVDSAWAEIVEWREREEMRAGRRQEVDAFVEEMRADETCRCVLKTLRGVHSCSGASTALQEFYVYLDGLESCIGEVGATDVERRSIGRTCHQIKLKLDIVVDDCESSEDFSKLVEAFQDSCKGVTDLFEEAAETIYRGIESDTEDDREPPEPIDGYDSSDTTFSLEEWESATLALAQQQQSGRTLSRTELLAEILAMLFGEQATSVAKMLASKMGSSSARTLAAGMGKRGAALAVAPQVQKRYGPKPGPGWTSGGVSRMGTPIWLWGAAPTQGSSAPPPTPQAPAPVPTPVSAPPQQAAPLPPAAAPATPSQAPILPNMPAQLGGGGTAAAAASRATHAYIMAKLQAGQQLTPSDKAMLAKRLTNMPTGMLRSLHTALGGSGAIAKPQVIASVKAILAGGTGQAPPQVASPTPPASTPPQVAPTPPVTGQATSPVQSSSTPTPPTPPVQPPAAPPNVGDKVTVTSTGDTGTVAHVDPVSGDCWVDVNGVWQQHHESDLTVGGATPTSQQSATQSPPTPSTTPQIPPATPPVSPQTPPSSQPKKGVLAQSTAPTVQRPINLATAYPVDYSGKNGAQIDPTWSGLDYQGVDPKYGAVICRVDPVTGKAQVLLTKPKNYYGNTSWTWAKGTPNQGEDAITTAKREAMEEAGAGGDIIGHLSGTYTENSKSGLNAYFLIRQSGNIDDAAWQANNETAEVKWVDLDQAHTLIKETAESTTASDPNGQKDPSFVNWQRDADVLEQVKASLIPGYKPQVNRRVDVLNGALQPIAAQIRATALAAQDGLITPSAAQSTITSITSKLAPLGLKTIASAMRAGGGTVNDFLGAVAKADPGHVGPALTHAPTTGLTWDTTTNKWKASPPPPAPTPQSSTAAPTPVHKPFVPKTGLLSKTDYEDLDHEVGSHLTSMGLTAEQALNQGAASGIYKTLSPRLDSSVGHYEVERTLRHLWAQQTTTPIPAQFDHFGTGRKRNAALPVASRPKNLTPDEITAAQKWTSSAYIPWARALRETGAPPPKFAKEDADLQSAFGKVKTFSTPVNVERHLTLDPNTLNTFLTNARASLSAGSTVTYPSYQATSTAPVPSNFHGNVEMRINAVHGLDMGLHHHHPHVKELLLNHNSQFKVTNIQQVGGRWVVSYDQVAPTGKVAAPKAAKVATGFQFDKDVFKSTSVQDFLSGKIPMTTNIGTGSYGSTSKDYTLLNTILTESGRNAKPQVLDSAGMSQLTGSGWTSMYRGVNDVKYTDKFRDDDAYHDGGSGARVYGSGTYIQKSKGGAQGYGIHCLHIAMPPKSKIVKMSTLKRAQTKAINAVTNDTSIQWPEKQKRIEVLRDEGLFAALNNYDAIDCQASGYFVLLNRAMCAVQKDNV